MHVPMLGKTKINAGSLLLKLKCWNHPNMLTKSDFGNSFKN